MTALKSYHKGHRVSKNVCPMGPSYLDCRTEVDTFTGLWATFSTICWRRGRIFIPHRKLWWNLGPPLHARVEISQYGVAKEGTWYTNTRPQYILASNQICLPNQCFLVVAGKQRPITKYLSIIWNIKLYSKYICFAMLLLITYKIYQNTNKKCCITIVVSACDDVWKVGACDEVLRLEN